MVERRQELTPQGTEERTRDWTPEHLCMEGGYDPGTGVGHQGPGAGERLRDRGGGLSAFITLTGHVYHSSNGQGRKDDRRWVKGEASPRTQGLRRPGAHPSGQQTLRRRQSQPSVVTASCRGGQSSWNCPSGGSWQ